MGCMPILCIAPPACIAIGWALRLTHPAIQTANYGASPLQGPLIFSFVCLGATLVLLIVHQTLPSALILHGPIQNPVVQLLVLPCEELLGWLVVAVPAVAAVMLVPTPLLHRMPKGCVYGFAKTAIS